MKAFAFKKIDAFAMARSAGNPAGFIWLDAKDDISRDEMQRIARELKGFVSEVGFAYAIDDDTFRLTYFSSECEVEFCGHATIAIVYDILRNAPHLACKPEISIVTNKGRLVVDNQISTCGSVFIMSPSPVFRPADISRDEIAKALHLQPSEIGETAPVSIVNAGLETLIVPIRSLRSILSMAPELQTLKQFCVQHRADIVEVFCDEVSGAENRFRTRVFAPTFGYLEDPATGSGNSAFGYYLLRNGLWDSSPLSIEQNGNPDDFNRILLRTRPDETRHMRVLFGGSAVTRIEGKYLLP